MSFKTARLLHLVSCLVRNLSPGSFAPTAAEGGCGERFRQRLERIGRGLRNLPILRRALGWDETILAREWLELAPAGNGRYGPVAQEIRTWSVDGHPVAWSFHHMHLVERARGFPPLASDLTQLKSMARNIASAFRSRLVVSDFARDRQGKWWFIEAGPGSCAGTGHETVFKAVARRLVDDESQWIGDSLGGPL